MATYQPQQPGVPIPVQSYPQYIQQQPAQPLTVPPHLQRPLLYVSISLVCAGSGSTIFGIIGAATGFYGIANWSGVNLWAGIFVCITNQTN